MADPGIIEAATAVGAFSGGGLAGYIAHVWRARSSTPHEPLPCSSPDEQVRADVRDIQTRVIHLEAMAADLHSALPSRSDLERIGAERATAAHRDERIASALEDLAKRLKDR